MDMMGLRDPDVEYMSIVIKPDDVVSFGDLFRFNVGLSRFEGTGFSSYYLYVNKSELVFYSTECYVHEAVITVP